MNALRLTVPFIYEAIVIKPRCRKPSMLVIHDFVDIEIPVVDNKDFPVAFKIGETELRWDGQRLWDFDYMSAVGEETKKVPAFVVEHNTAKHNVYRFSGASSEAPFHAFWDRSNLSIARSHGLLQCGMNYRLTDCVSIDKEDAVYREWVADNREAVIDRAYEIASNLRVFDDYMYAPAGEPRYVAMTFGLSNNHGGTALFIDQHCNENIGEDRYFTALQYEEAIASATAIAEGRGDDKSLPMHTNCGNVIEVLIPEAVTLKPNKCAAKGAEFADHVEHAMAASGNA
ncbi:hypothetical protein [Neptuniibacter sp. QD37_11]|uniref:hypothetical protein n=1 Tax=Neptuniibacter sp. QD37_11 TaxID=3398209 RepID=UPI0039F494A0